MNRKVDSSKQPVELATEKEKVRDLRPPKRAQDIKCFKRLGHGQIY